MLEPTFPSMRQAHCASFAHASHPIHLQKAGKQSSSHGASDVVVSLCPVQTFVCKGPPQPMKQIGIDVEGTEKLCAQRCHRKGVLPLAKRASPQEFIS